MASGYTDKIVMSIGGSLIIPNGGIDTDFLSKLNRFVREELARNKNRQFFLIVGGGYTTRHYQKAAQEVLKHDITPDDLDWIGIHATRLNAHLIRTILRDITHPYIIKHYEIIRKVTEPVVVASGWKPGWSTDFDAVLICEDYGAKTLLNLSNISYVYDKDPNKSKDAKPLKHVSWNDFRKIVGNKWSPGLNAPFDPVAAKRAQELGVKVIVLNGNNLDNLQNYMEGKKFVGTVIE